MNKAQKREFQLLAQSWLQMYMPPGTSEEERLVNIRQDMLHPPAGLGQLLFDLIQECIDSINNQVESMSTEDPEFASFDFVVGNLANSIMLIGHRMFRLGQSTRLKYEDLTPCTCTEIPDDDIEEFLRRETEGPKTIEGVGWVILDFGKEVDE
jgi:hypothetical protein